MWGALFNSFNYHMSHLYLPTQSLLSHDIWSEGKQIVAESASKYQVQETYLLQLLA